jgi:hypothetical protein
MASVFQLIRQNSGFICVIVRHDILPVAVAARLTLDPHTNPTLNTCVLLDPNL